jgi:5'-phosphate synthase pdxT subunit
MPAPFRRARSFRPGVGRSRIGVVAFQGDVSEHVLAMERALEGEGSVVEIRKGGIVPDCEGIILPGGESTTIARHLARTGVGDEIRAAAESGVPIMATCAGLIVISKEIVEETRFLPLGLLDVRVARNAFGSQKESFEADLDVEGFSSPYHAVFIRAPAIVGWEDHVEVLAKIDEMAVAARQDNLMGLAFHPELTEDLRFHEIFLDMI